MGNKLLGDGQQPINMTNTDSKYDQLHIKYQVAGPEELLVFLGGYAYKNLASLNLEYCNIGALGCRLLIQGKWPNMRNVGLKQNKIGNQGCVHLAKSEWRDLRNLNLIGNKINDQACFILSKSHWPKIKNIQFNQDSGNERRRNIITHRGIVILTLGHKKNYCYPKATSQYRGYFHEIDQQGDLL